MPRTQSLRCLFHFHRKTHTRPTFGICWDIPDYDCAHWTFGSTGQFISTTQQWEHSLACTDSWPLDVMAKQIFDCVLCWAIYYAERQASVKVKSERLSTGRTKYRKLFLFRGVCQPLFSSCIPYSENLLVRLTLIFNPFRFVNSLVYYGLSLNSSGLGGNDYINFLILGAIEFPSYLMCQILLKRVGRRWPLTVCLLLGGIALLLTVPIPKGRHTGCWTTVGPRV